MPAGLEKEEKVLKTAGPVLNQEEEEQIRHGHVQEQASNRNQEASVSQDVAELRRKKDQLLAKMREIDYHNHVRQQDGPLGRYSPSLSPCFTEQNNNY